MNKTLCVAVDTSNSYFKNIPYVRGVTLIVSYTIDEDYPDGYRFDTVIKYNNEGFINFENHEVAFLEEKATEEVLT